MDDLISRQAAIEWCLEGLNNMPSADRPSGHWVLINRGLDIYMCDQCGEILQIDRLPIWDYCPLCGARM